ncbi:MAG TPA: FG-GAP-like repeat-containing protein [Candidatus Krumholzibacteria bacterium]|nr:FG-GAP-like repeat-containing protein [Candidatus Krumholzibacteria bacterium]HRX51447.1 FG-GAP-like repeat-containing protein [Candidatus Krumholzibacteria bacterium]
MGRRWISRCVIFALILISGTSDVLASTPRNVGVDGVFEYLGAGARSGEMRVSWNGTFLNGAVIKNVRIGYYGTMVAATGPRGTVSAGDMHAWHAEIPVPESAVKLKVEFVVDRNGGEETIAVTAPFARAGTVLRPMDRESYIQAHSDPEGMMLDSVQVLADEDVSAAGKATFSFSIGKVTYDRLTMDPASERRLPRAFIDVRTRNEGSSSWIVREQEDLEDDGSYLSGTWDATAPFTLRIELRTQSDRNEHVEVARESGQTYAVAVEFQITSTVHHIIPQINIPESLGTTWEAFAIFGGIQDAWQWMDDEANESISSVDVVYPTLDTEGYAGWYDCDDREIRLIEHGTYWTSRGILHHEYGHHVQCREYGSIAGCNVPYVEDACGEGNDSDSTHWASMPSCPEFAWAEGFAEFMECVVDGVPGYLGDVCPPVGTIDDNTWYRTDGDFGDGCVTEGSIASILWDAADDDSESGDALALGFGDLVDDVILGEQPTSAADLAIALVDETNDFSAVEALFARYGCDICDVMPLLPAPQLMAPADGATGQPLDVTLSWSGVGDAEEYAVQLGVACGDGTIRTTTSTQMTYMSLSPNTLHYWRVGTKNECGEWGEWSACRTFRTVSDDPVCRVSTVALNFESALIGQPDTRPFTIHNDGGGVLVGMVSSDCPEVTFEPVSYSVPGGGSVEIQVTYTPHDCGGDVFTIDPGTSCAQAIGGTAVGPDTPSCVLSASTIQVVSDALGQTSTAQFEIFNDGCGALAGTVGSDCTPEIVIAPTAYDLGPGESALIEISYTPVDNGTDLCAITTGCGAVAVTAIGPDPICEVSVESVGIQVDVIGGQGSRTFSITNSGTGVLEGQITGSADTEFAVSPKLYAIHGGESQVFNVVYIPADCGNDIVFIDTGTDCPDVMLKGLGPYLPICDLSTDAVTLDASADGLPVSQSLWITNANCGILSGDVVWDCGDFTVVPAAYELGAGQTQEIVVTFTPSGPGTVGCPITFGDCGTVQATGIGQGNADCTIEPGVLHLATAVGSQVSLPVIVTNSGETTLSGTFVSCDPTLTIDVPGYDLSPGDQHVVTVTFTPVAVGPVECEIVTGLPCGTVNVQALGLADYCATSIDELQTYGLDCDPFANPCIDEQVLLEGVVYVVRNYSIGGHYMQGASGGINFYDPDAIPLVPGDRIRIEGPAWYDSNNEIYVGWPTITWLGHEAVPVPTPVATGALQDCELIGSYVEAQGVVTEVGVNGGGEDYYLLDDGSGPVMVYIDPDTGADMDAVQVGETWRVWSPAMNFSGEIRVSPISSAHHSEIAGAFSDIASGGAASVEGGSGVAWVDRDMDGDPDLLLARNGVANLLLRNDGGYYVPLAAGILEQAGVNNTAATLADADNDGRMDVYLLNAAGGNLMAMGDPAGFVDGTTGPLGGNGATWGAAWRDMDSDGLLDLMVSNAGGQNLLLRNSELGFQDVAPDYLRDIMDTQTVSWCDIDLDGDPDLLILADSGTSVLLRNDGTGPFDTDPFVFSQLTGAQGAAWGDYDGDRYPDLYITCWGEPNRLYRNDGGTGFTRVSMPAVENDGWSQGAAWADYDLDGDLDLYIANYNAARPNRLFRNDEGTLVDAEIDVVADAGQSVGVAWADHDLDGDPDLYVVNATSANRLFLNNQTTGNHWIQVRLTGQTGQSNHAAIGARVEIQTASGIQVREVSSQEGYLSQGDLVLCFGLGSDAEVEIMRVIWPRKYANGQYVIQEEAGLAVDRRYDVVEPYTTAVDAVDEGVPSAYRLIGAVPNPFNPMTTIRFEIPADTEVDLEVYDLAGRRVRRLVSHEMLLSGSHARLWDGTRDDGSPVPTGVYVCRMRAGRDFQQSLRMILLK